MDEGRIVTLEAAVADVGALLVRARKYRAGAGPEGDALFRTALALGDRARHVHRQDVVETEATDRLLDEARRLAERIRGLVRHVHESADYRRAVAALAAGDHDTLAPALTAVFAGLEAVTPPPALYHPLAWRRRGRPRPPAELAGEVARLATDGLAPDGDELAPGVDPALPAVALTAEPAVDEALSLRLAGQAVGAPIHRLVDTGEYLVHVARLRAPFAVVVRAVLEADDAEGIADYDAYRDALVATVAAGGVPVEVV